MKNKNAFTLIELLIVVAIIAILAAIAVPNFLEAQVRSKVSRAKSDQRSLATAIEAYRVDNNKYHPCDVLQCPPNTHTHLTPTAVRVQRFAWITTPIAYITSAPNDPFAPARNESPANPNQLLNIQNPVHVYWDSDYWDAFKTGGSTNASLDQDLATEKAIRGTWALISFGPDRDFEAAVSWPPTYLAVYDATNGTVSNGDIFRFAGTGVR